MTIWTALAIWLAVSVIATALAGRFLFVCAQADQHEAEDLADSLNSSEPIHGGFIQ